MSSTPRHCRALSGSTTAAQATLLPGPARRAMVALPAEESRVAEARRFASLLLSRWGVAEEDRFSAVLIIGELAGNAAQHGRADMTVTLTLIRRTLCIEVVDSGLRVERICPHSADPEDERGRGLGMVDQVAERTEIVQEQNCRRALAVLLLDGASVLEAA
ncbi:ATP-binding protein [Streptomyces sp. NPDC048473]|uniref:ATP-binding protein n=1 Tax=unclassified Streptomyces TaxID=2593676 RepID=UPI0037110238